MKNTWVIVLVIIVVGLGGYLFLARNQTQAPAPTTDTVMDTGSTIQLAEQNASGESGTAVLTEENGKVVVTINMTGSPVDVPQPAHIHTGSCPDVGAVTYPLTNLVNGVSVTTLDVPLSQLKAEQPMGINIHKSVPEVSVYTACGDLAL